jgi:hypothetical protein
MLHNICRLSFLQEMDSQQKDPISPQCAIRRGALPRTRMEEEIVIPQPKSICKGSMIIFAGRPPSLHHPKIVPVTRATKSGIFGGFAALPCNECYLL